jgi:hypothetical protein
VLCVSRFGLPGHFEAAGDLCGKNISGIRPYLKILRARSTARLIMEDGEEQTEGIFYGAIATKSYARTLRPPIPRIVYPADKPSHCVP